MKLQVIYKSSMSIQYKLMTPYHKIMISVSFAAFMHLRLHYPM